MENNFVLTPTPLNEFLESVRAIIKDELKAQQLADLQEKLLSPKEVCGLFTPRISLPTLARWSDQGLINKYNLGGKIIYKYSEVMESMKSIKKFSMS